MHILSTEVLRFERFLRCHWISWIIFLRYYCRMLPFDQSVQVDAYVDLQHFVTRTSNYTVYIWLGWCRNTWTTRSTKWVRCSRFSCRRSFGAQYPPTPFLPGWKDFFSRVTYWFCFVAHRTRYVKSSGGCLARKGEASRCWQRECPWNNMK